MDLTGAPLIDLDDLYWFPNWVEKSDEEFTKDVDLVLDKPAWIVAGNYGAVLGERPKQADLIIYLNYSLPTILKRFIKRSFTRVVLKEPCCNGNYESFADLFLKKDGLFWWILSTWRQRHTRSLAFIADQDKHSYSFHEISSRSQLVRFLEEFRG